MNHFEYRVTPKEQPVRGVWVWPALPEAAVRPFGEPGDVLDWPVTAAGE